MATELKMPALSPTMEKGTLAKWLVRPGDTVKAGDLVAEIETDKATMEFEASEEGVVSRILVPDGSEDVAVGTVLALLTEKGAAVTPGAVLEEAMTTISGLVEESPSPPRLGTAPVSKDMAHAAFPRARFADKVKVSPLAARVADAKGIDLATITGSGPHGRIVRADLALPASIAAPSAAAPAPLALAPAIVIASPPEGVPVETVKLSGMRKTIARRLTESNQTVPHFYLTARCNLDPLLKLRAELNAGLASRGIKLSVNDMLMKALAMALVQVPDANVQFGGDVLHRFSRVDIAMAVAINGGLVTPVVRGVDTLSLSAIARLAQEMAAKARDGKLAPKGYQGGTASLSNLGMFGIDEMVPVINPPQALILGTAAGIQQPWNVNGEIRLATIMAATASFDHRAIDGAIAAQFMKAFRELVEDPLTILG
ncbi:dihydrolipoamide acetyltransferase family protein [Sphingobium sp. HWE2-09]|uniref:dihydrolipoamide acetyltransferase family protein n=1 Tax=Sphingobium sp. HWE2-09 TaxID=3108390 RepID=UPI002DC425CA|nr:dihydrolipoamide acetyltransferase family protein [Sphingobium sp. HWE2-09]